MESGGFTALMYMARIGDLEAVRLLLDLGADVKLKNHNGKTVLREAIEGHELARRYQVKLTRHDFWQSWTSLVGVLFEHGSSLDERDAEGVSVWEYIETVHADVFRCPYGPDVLNDFIATAMNPDILNDQYRHEFVNMLKRYRR